MDTSCTPNLH